MPNLPTVFLLFAGAIALAILSVSTPISPPSRAASPAPQMLRVQSLPPEVQHFLESTHTNLSVAGTGLLLYSPQVIDLEDDGGHMISLLLFHKQLNTLTLVSPRQHAVFSRLGTGLISLQIVGVYTHDQ